MASVIGSNDCGTDVFLIGIRPIKDMCELVLVQDERRIGLARPLEQVLQPLRAADDRRLIAEISFIG